ncbi:MAG: glycosyltransferase family 39 protein [Acidobacteria bacterium]|nr:glycosyltransferase family 39 protein [Acidobacteriota bacterium]
MKNSSLLSQADTTGSRREDVLCGALLALFTLCLLLVARSYHLTDRRPPTFDDAWYLESSLHFYHQLTSGGLPELVSAYAGSFRTKAPLISVLPLPFYLLLGERFQSAILVNFTFLALTSVYLFLLGRRLFSAGVGLAAVVFYQTMPLAYGLARVFMPDYGLAALVVIWLYYLAASDRLRRGSAIFALGVVSGLGLLMKILFPVYVAAPLLVVLLRRRKEKPEPAEEAFWLWRFGARHPLVALAAPCLALAASWYPFHLGTILRYAWEAGYGEIGSQYSDAGVARWIVQVINEGMSSYYAAAFGMLGLAALALVRPPHVAGPSGRGDRAGLLLGWIVPPLLAIVAGRNREIRFILPVLPAFALLLAASVFRLGRRPAVQALLVALLAIVPLRLFAVLSSHSSVPQHHGFEHPLMLGPFILFGRDLGWARPPDAEGRWGQERILGALDQMGPPSATPRYVVVGVEHRFLNANLLSYLNSYTHYPLLFHSLGYAESSEERAVERIYSLDARFLVTAEGFHSFELAQVFNQVNGGIQQRLDRGELPFRLRAKVALTDRVKAAIYERESPWVRFLPGAPAEAPSHPLPVDFYGGIRFLGYDWKRVNPYLYQLSFYWTTVHRVYEDYRVNLDFRRGGQTVLLQDHYVGGGLHPFYEWEPGEVVKQSMAVYSPVGGPSGPSECRLWLTRWGMGDPHQITDPKEMIHQSVVPLRLEE